MAKMVRAKRTGFWDGHRRRPGSVFAVRDDADESWFEPTGEKASDAALPSQLPSAQAAPAKGFVQLMMEMGQKKAQEQAKTLAQAQEAVDDGSSLV